MILLEHDEIIERDYLALDHKQLEVKDQKIHIIGNPPFGRQSKTAIKFIKKYHLPILYNFYCRVVLKRIA